MPVLRRLLLLRRGRIGYRLLALRRLVRPGMQKLPHGAPVLHVKQPSRTDDDQGNEQDGQHIWALKGAQRTTGLDSELTEMSPDSSKAPRRVTQG